MPVKWLDRGHPQGKFWEVDATGSMTGQPAALTRACAVSPQAGAQGGSPQCFSPAA